MGQESAVFFIRGFQEQGRVGGVSCSLGFGVRGLADDGTEKATQELWEGLFYEV